MFTYIAFYKGKQIEVKALRSYDAQQIASKILKARKSYEVTVMLASKDDAIVIHHPATI